MEQGVKTKKTVFCLVGLTGSGKSFVASKLAELFQCEVINIGDIVRSFTDKPLELKDSPKLAKAIFKRVDKEFERKNNVVLDGIRETYLLKEIKKKYTAFVIAIVASDSTRFIRYAERECISDLLHGLDGYQEFLAKTKEEKLIGVEECMKVADCVIENN